MARPRSDIAPRIVQAARKRFLAHGVDGASLREIAAAARTSIGMVYYYYPTKDDLFLAVVEEVYVKLIDEMTRALGPATPPLEQRVEQLYARFHEMDEEEVTVMRIVIRELLTSTERRQKLIERFLRGHIPVLLGAVTEAKRRGEVSDRLHPMTVALCTMLLGFFPALVVKLAGSSLPPSVRPPDGAAIAAQLVEILFHGLQGRGARG